MDTRQKLTELLDKFGITYHEVGENIIIETPQPPKLEDWTETSNHKFIHLEFYFDRSGRYEALEIFNER